VSAYGQSRKAEVVECRGRKSLKLTLDEVDIWHGLVKAAGQVAGEGVVEDVEALEFLQVFFHVVPDDVSVLSIVIGETLVPTIT